MKKTLLASLLLTLLPGAHASETLSPWYLGAGIGINDFEPNCDSKTMKVCGDDSGAAWDVFAGYLLNEHFAFELGYRDLNSADWTDYADKINDVSVNGISFGLNTFWPINEKWHFSVEAGAFAYDLENDSADYDYSDDGVSPYFGAGVGYRFTEKLSLLAKYRRYENLGENKLINLDFESNYWGLILSYRFGETSTPMKPTPAPLDTDRDGVIDSEDACPDTPFNHKVDAKGCSIYKDKLVRMAIAAKFDNDSAVIQKQSYGEIEKLAKFMERYPKAQVKISGHASNVGAADYNLTLSQQRADAVADMLSQRYNIEASRVSAKGYGITQPLMEGSSSEANAVNRRIEAEVSGSHKEVVLK